MESLIEMREKITTDGLRDYKDCSRCPHYQKKEWHKSRRITNINFSMSFYSPCDCKCVYCGAIKKENRHSKAESEKMYNILFDALDYAKRRDFIDHNASCYVASGEITIHPYREKLLDFVKDKPTEFLTNCFRFDEKIGQFLKSDSRNRLNLSIDSGTSETWHRVKGVDNYEKVINNLCLYFGNCSNNNQKSLKYIVLPGINDNNKDYLGVIRLMKKLGVPALMISRDVLAQYNCSVEDRQQLIQSAGRLAVMLTKNSLIYYPVNFFPDEASKIADIVIKAKISHPKRHRNVIRDFTLKILPHGTRRHRVVRRLYKMLVK